jgi:hypothetical protein
MRVCIIMAFFCIGEACYSNSGVDSLDLSRKTAILFRVNNMRNLELLSDSYIGVSIPSGVNSEFQFLGGYGYGGLFEKHNISITVGMHKYFLQDDISKCYYGGYVTGYFAASLEFRTVTGSWFLEYKNNFGYGGGLCLGILFFPRSFFQISVDYAVEYQYFDFDYFGRDSRRHELNQIIRFTGRFVPSVLF